VHEAICHAGDSIKALINEHWGDGIMSGIGALGQPAVGVGRGSLLASEGLSGFRQVGRSHA
jgi:hypothetical protein